MTEPHYHSDRDWHPDPYTPAYTTDGDWATFPEPEVNPWSEYEGAPEKLERAQRAHDRMSRGFFIFWILFCVILPITWAIIAH